MFFATLADRFSHIYPAKKIQILKQILVNKESLAQVLSCEFCEIFKNTFFYRTSPVAASVRQSFFRKQLATENLYFRKKFHLKGAPKL